MRVMQGHVPEHMVHFEDGFLKKWNLVPYTDPNSPCVFLDISNSHTREMIARHKSLAIVIWGGGDTSEENADFVGRLKHAVTPVYGPFKVMMQEFGHVNWVDKVLALKSYKDFAPVTLGDKIYFYSGDDSDFKKKYYGLPYLEPVIDYFGRDRFIIAIRGNEINWLRDNFYSKSFVSVRINPWAGATTMWELGHMGIKTICNMTNSAPCAIAYRSVEDIINAIKQEEKKIGTIQTQVARDTKKFMNEHDDSWLYTEYWEGMWTPNL
jgi:hypothetical protein